MGSNKHILIGTVGYHILRNHSIGPILLPRLKKWEGQGGIAVEELNWGPIAVVQQFQALTRPYDRVVILAAVERPGRQIGQATVFQWKGGLPDEAQIQACVGDAATGVISVENLLVIGEYFQIWPEEVFILDVEPGPEQAGIELTPEVEARAPDILQLCRRLAEEGAEAAVNIDFLRGDQIFEYEKQ